MSSPVHPNLGDVDPLEVMAAHSGEFMDRNAIRVQARNAGVTLDYASDEQLDALLTRCGGEVEFAVIAATRQPRPDWAIAVIGRRVEVKPTNMTR